MKLPTTPQPVTNTTAQTTPLKSPPTTAQQLVSQLKLQPGQTLNIQVVQQKGQQLTFRLPQLPNQTFHAETDNTLKSGQAYQVKILQTQPKLQLQLQAQPSPAQTQALTAQALRQKLPNMQPLTQVLQQLTQPEFLKQLPTNLQAGLQKLLDNMLKPQNKLQGNTLKQLSQQSGLFLESKLAQNQSPQGDLKGKLIQLQNQLQHQLKADPKSPTLQQTHKSIGQLLDRITLQQIESIQKGLWQTEIPLQPQPYFKQLTLKLHRPSHEQTQTWQAELHLDTQEGEWLTHFFYNSDSQQLRLHLWFDNETLKHKVQQHQSELIDLLQQNGFQVAPIHYLPEKPQTPDLSTSQALIDIKI